MTKVKPFSGESSLPGNHGIVAWMSSSLVYLRDQLAVTTVWNTGETGDIYEVTY